MSFRRSAHNQKIVPMVRRTAANHHETPIFYTFYLQGIPNLSAELLGAPMLSSPTVEPTPEATACEPHHTIKNFTN
ncbi:hypothetical protein Taro_051606 [Colocasia esculenta]|uniref:allene-oxide cyclase n=1 Tax=Colocasia esculenta TaxID=4460 RepID=A0A843XGI8_COLES|nr:hypothetical protein [Colocasia esculenta]